MENCPDFSGCERVISSRWMLPILAFLDGPKRFGAIQAELGVSRSVLASQLGELVRMGLVRQNKFSRFPPVVEYSRSEQGQALVEILSGLPAAMRA